MEEMPQNNSKTLNMAITGGVEEMPLTKRRLLEFSSHVLGAEREKCCEEIVSFF
jgi:hypothetical protein